MKETSHQPESPETTNHLTTVQERRRETFVPSPLPVATDTDILAYLRRSGKMGEVAVAAEQDVWVIDTCKELGITVSDDEWQAAGDTFRLEHKLLGSTETFAWMAQQRTTVEAWSEGIKIALLTQKLQDYLVGGSVDGAYISDRDNYRRVALSQILVADLSTARTIVQKLREDSASLCSLALTYSKGRQSQENGGFVGIRFLVELMPEISQAIRNVQEGEVVGPIQTRLGYHILRVEKWFPTELSQEVRSQILNSVFQAWLQQARANRDANPNANLNGNGKAN